MHRTDGMVDIAHKRCEEPGCDTLPCFGLVGDNTPSHCAMHKTDSMVNVVSKRCEEPGCLKQPSFGLAGSRSSRRCGTHKTDGMVDVKNKRFLLGLCSSTQQCPSHRNTSSSAGSCVLNASAS